MSNEGGGKKGLSAGAIAGIVIAAVSLIILAALLFFFWGCLKGLKDEVNQKAGTVRRVSPDSSTGMLDATRPPGNGYQNYQQCIASPPPMEQQQSGYGYGTPGYAGTPNFSSPAPSYFSPQQQQGKFEQTASSPPPMNIHRALSHRSVGGTFELSPTGDYARTHDRAASPHCLATQDKLGPYGQQVYGNTTLVQAGTTSPEAIPSYFETVYRPDPMHVNQSVGPAEMDGTETAVSPDRVTPALKPAWEEVEKRGMF
jgi:hypothetical protein